jgi:hypothetical protein
MAGVRKATNEAAAESARSRATRSLDVSTPQYDFLRGGVCLVALSVALHTAVVHGIYIETRR